ncbi:MAG: hypothetical protein DYH13_03050 [Alphaproteobacteria bacterium PRO2]|nr:hypothetical protein [Alphaproteobacteria bacterium PRO2]
MVDKPKDDNAFEDADFEDLDALEDDDLGDETWDDDLGGADAADDAGGGDDDEPRAPGEKTFVQKNFMLIVGAVVVVFGGLIAVAFMGGGSPSPLPDEQAAAPGDALPDAPAATAYEDGADMPPMPAPINPQQADGALTPMPMPGDLQDTQLAELDVDEVPAQPPSGTVPQGEEPFDYRSTEQREGSDEPAPKNAAEKLSAEFKNRTETDPVAPVHTPSETLIDGEGNIIAMPAPVIPEENKAGQQQQPAPAAAEPAPTLQASAPSPQLEAQNTRIESLQSQLTTQESRAAEAEKATKALEDSLKSKDEEIAALSKKIEELEQKLASAERAPAPEKQASAPKAAKPASAPAAEKPAAKQTASPAPQQAKAPAAPARVVSWELKAAQPGKAVLESRSTGDTRNVSVGDTVDGLGKITAISNETGRWTVRGTKGQVIR